MASITANDLKTRGITSIEEALKGRPEAIVSVRGADRFVVMELSQYHYLRECELEAALAQSRVDIREGRYVKESAQAHVARAFGLNAKEAAPRTRNTGTKAATPPATGKRTPAKTGKLAAR